jgi:hypothetical protein
VPGRSSVFHGRISARWARAFGAAVVAVAALLTAAHAGPARAAGPETAQQAQHDG